MRDGGGIIYERETVDTLVVIIVQILIMQNVQDGLLIRVMATDIGSGTNSTIPCNVSKNHVLSL